MISLELACGANKTPGYHGVDIAPLPGVDSVVDLLSFPWPFADASADRVLCSHFFEHVPARLRPAFMNEVWRVLGPGGTAEFRTPLGLWRQCQDPTHEWPPIVPGSFSYFDMEWLDANGLGHYRDLLGLRCDFAVDLAGMAMAEPFRAAAGPEAVWALAKYTQNAAEDMRVVLTKRVADG